MNKIAIKQQNQRNKLTFHQLVQYQGVRAKGLTHFKAMKALGLVV